MKKVFLLSLLVVLMAASIFAGPKYIFLFIGDGMAQSQINSAQMLISNLDNVVDPKLTMLTFPVSGLTTTYSSDSFITDSAAAGTALSTGFKTNSGVICYDPEINTKYKTIAEVLKEKGYKIGILSSVSLDHATPAAFFAHQSSRSNYYEIGVEMVNSGFDFFGGGSIKYPAGKKGDQPNALEIAVANGYKIIDTQAGFEKLGKDDGKVIVFNERLDGSKAMRYDMDRKSEFSLADITEKAIEMLDNEKGFFIMVEGGKIDWACHANDAAASIKDTLAFDAAIKEAVDFYKENPEDTLIVVTGDHETGGLTLGFAGTGYVANVALVENQKVSYEEFDSILNSRKKAGEISKFADLIPLIEEYFALSTVEKEFMSTLSAYEIERLQNAFYNYITGTSINAVKDGLAYGGYNPVSVTLTHILNEKAGLGWTSYAHTGVPVSTFAMGNGQENFGGYYDNTDIAKRLFALTK